MVVGRPAQELLGLLHVVGIERRPARAQVVGDFELHAPAVLVTSGGIGGNFDLVRANWAARMGRVPLRMVAGVPDFVDGRMIAITQAAGGRVVNPDRMWHYVEGIHNYDPVWTNHGIRILPGPSSVWLDATGTRLPVPLFPGFDTLGTLEHIMSTGHDHTWFVTTQVLDLSASGSGVLGNLVDPQRIAVAGHSDGGYVSFGDGFQPLRLDPRVRAVVSYAASFAYAGLYQPNGRAILHVHSDTDEYNPYDEAVAWDAANLQDPKTVMTMVNGTHLAPYTDPSDPHFATLVDVTIGFLDMYLKGHPENLYGAVVRAAAQPSIARFD